MMRFICALFKIEFEPCKGCEVLKQQLAIANEEKELYHRTFLDILRPKVIEPVPVEMKQPQMNGPMLMSRRKQILAEADAQRARAEKSPFIGRSDNDVIKNAEANKNIVPATQESIKALEEELGLGAEEETNAVR